MTVGRGKDLSGKFITLAVKAQPSSYVATSFKRKDLTGLGLTNELTWNQVGINLKS